MLKLYRLLFADGAERFFAAFTLHEAIHYAQTRYAAHYGRVEMAQAVVVIPLNTNIENAW